MTPDKDKPPLEDLIAAARGETEADLLLEGAEMVNVLSGEVHRADIAVYDGWIVGYDCMSAKDTLDLAGTVLSPGFIDGHVHIESAMVSPQEYARAVAPRGTTSVMIDPHEIANVLGLRGIGYMLDASEEIPLNVYVMLPSCVPATDLETSGAVLEAEDLAPLMDNDRVIGIGEMMNYPGVIFRNPAVLEKIRLAGTKRIDGHAPGLTGKDLAAYISAGIRSDHECTSTEEAEEKLRMGMRIIIREGSAAKNLRDLLPLVTPYNAANFFFCSDDRHPADILREGHIDHMVRVAVGMGLSPVTAIQIATINAARYFGVADIGAIAPGRRADIAVLDGLDDPVVLKVIKDGKLTAEGGELRVPVKKTPYELPPSMQIAILGPSAFEMEARGARARVIGVVPDQIVTRSLACEVEAQEGKVVSDTERDILKMAVIERHHATGNVGLGLVSGFGFRSGAIATSVAHDSHNLVVVGADDGDMLVAAKAVEAMGGGQAVVEGGETKVTLPLPVAGLLSDRPMKEVARGIEKLNSATRELGCGLADPFMTLSFLCLPVIPELKLTDKGLVDVNKFQFVDLFLQ